MAPNSKTFSGPKMFTITAHALGGLHANGARHHPVIQVGLLGEELDVVRCCSTAFAFDCLHGGVSRFDQAVE
jgi:hypothetical protein